jgi:carboxyl-terminal processing protease
LRRTLLSAVGTVAVVGAVAIGMSLAGGGATPAGADTVLLEHVRTELLRSYYRPVPANVLRQPSVSAMLGALQDPYTEYLDRTKLHLLRRETRSSYSGVGIGVLPVDEGLRVVRMKDGPARRAGLRVGDVITSIDGLSVVVAGYDRAIAKVLGPEGTTVRLVVRRESEDLHFDVVRARLSAPAVQSKLLAIRKLRIGYLRLSAFRTGAAPVVNATVKKLARSNAAGIILDLRGNPGGVFEQAVAVASLFLDKGVIVTLVGADAKPQVYSTTKTTATRLPLVVLVDRDSASAAEIVAAALQENRRAVLVGEHTFGKAIVQSLRPLPNGAALRLTTATYLTPEGNDINLRGVTPDLVARDVPATRADEGLNAALELFLR